METIVESNRDKEVRDFLEHFPYTVFDNGKGGIDVEARAEFGDTAAILAAEYGYFKVVKHCVENGADLNAKNSCDDTALIRAVVGEETEIANYILDKSSDECIEDVSTGVAISLAFRHKLPELAKRIYDKIESVHNAQEKIAA